MIAEKKKKRSGFGVFLGILLYVIAAFEYFYGDLQPATFFLLLGYIVMRSAES